MPMTADQIETLMRSAFPDAELRLTDFAGDNDHWDLHLATSQFKGKSRIEQHRMVYAALQGSMTTTLHALKLTTAVKD